MNRSILTILTLLSIALPLQAGGGKETDTKPMDKKSGKEKPEFNKEQQEAQRIFMTLKRQKDLATDLKSLLTNYETEQKKFADTIQKKFVSDVKASTNWKAIDDAEKALREKRQAEMKKKAESGEKPTLPADKKEKGWMDRWFGKEEEGASLPSEAMVE